MRPRRLLAAVAASCLLLLVVPTALAAGTTLVVGTVGDNVKKQMIRFQALTGYLQPRLGPDGIEQVRVAVASSTAAMAEMIRRGQVDLYIDSPLVVAKVARDSGVRPFLRRWKDGVAEYAGVIVARTDSGIRRLDDLRGRVIAFQGPDSTTGYLLPRHLIRQHGIALAEVGSPEAAPPADRLGYVFTGDDDDTILWLLKGKAAVAATDPKSFEKLASRHSGVATVIARTFTVPRQVAAHRAGLDPALVARIEAELLAMDGNEAGRQALQAFDRTTRFDRFPEGAEAMAARANAVLDDLERDGVR